MSKAMNRRIAVLLVCLQILLLLTAAMPQARAEGEAQQSAAPKLNRVYTGTVQFGTFNYTNMSYTYEYKTGGFLGLGETTHSQTWESSADGADYRMPFIYTDDYFAAPSYSEAFEAKLRQLKAEGKDTKTLNWTDLEDKSLATASMDFTMACFGSNEEATDEQDYTDGYDKNGRKFLEACGFEEIESNNYSYNEGDDLLKMENSFNKFPSKDSIGVIIGSKDITVWEGAEKGNQTYKLVAIGVRGAGYGAEWASNLTLGDGLQNKEHQGFREAANKVEYKLDDYMRDHGISATDNVKFWVCGYSRSGAVASLVAGDLTSKYGVDNHRVYGYTFESAAGADATVDPDGTKYPNIHNIINKMDAVPRVSMAAFGNNRYGVDYLVPYYGNTQDQGSLNTDYYNRMYSILKTVAQGYPNATRPDSPPSPSSYNSGSLKWTSELKVQDPVLASAKPNTDLGGTYPVDGKIMVYKFEIAEANNGNKGATEYDGPWNKETNLIGNKEGSRYYVQLDAYLDNLVNHLFGSRAWDYDPAHPTADISNTNFETHRKNYYTQQNGQKESYQDAIRDLVGIALGTPGAKLMDAFSNISGDLTSDLVSAAELLGSINGAFSRRGYDQYPDESHANTVNDRLKPILKNVLTPKEPFKSNKTATENAIDTLSPVIARLFLYDRKEYGSQFLGTLLNYMKTILVTHTPELDVSWQMAMDENYTSDYREITLPKNTVVRMLEFRGANTFGELGFDGAAPVVAEFRDGAAVDGTVLDSRIKVMGETETTFTIRYPGNIDVRFDVKASGDPIGDANVTLADLEPLDENGQITTNVTASYDRDADNGNITTVHPLAYTLVGSEAANTLDAKSINDFSAAATVALGENETLQITAKAGTNSLDAAESDKDAKYEIRKSAIKVVNFGEVQTVATYVGAEGSKVEVGGTFGLSGTDLTFTPDTDGNDFSAFSGLSSSTYSFVGDTNDISSSSKVDIIPATNIYYNDSHGSGADLSDHTQITTLFSNQENGAQSISIQFYGTGIDAYCTCDKDAGWVRAEVLDDQGQRVGKQKIVGNNYNDGNEGTLYNVPTVHFDLQTPGSYTLKLTADLGRDYKLDGVRVYNTAPNADVAAKLAQVDEADAAYVNIRDLLLGQDEAEQLDNVGYTGAVYFTGDGEKTSFANYQDIGPKREVYLTQAGQGIAFSVDDPNSVKVEIGLRRADGDTASTQEGSVLMNGHLQPVTGVDTYYPVTPDGNGNVKLEYGEGCTGKIAITYIKLTARTDAAPADEPVGSDAVIEPEAIGPQRIRASAKLLSFVNAPDPAPTEQPAPTPTPEPVPTPTPEPESTPTPVPTPSPTPNLSELFWSSLMRSIGRLFSGFGW